MKPRALLASDYAPALLGGLVTLAAALRWLLQGGGNVYTDLSKRLYVPDPDLGWRLAEESPVWLGLEAIGAIVAIALLSAALVWGSSRWRPAPRWALRGLWAPPVIALFAVVLAFASGSAPPSATALLPAGSIEAPRAGVRGGFAGVDAGSFVVLPHHQTAITARLSAGGETFEARFSRGIEGAWSGDPGDLTAPMKAEFSASAAAVDTGIALRSKHARESYLQVERHPRIALRLDRILAIEQREPDRVAFTAEATVTLIGVAQKTLLTGEMALADAAAKVRLGIDAPGDTFIIRTELAVRVSASPLAEDAGDFDDDLIPLSTTLILTRKPMTGARS